MNLGSFLRPVSHYIWDSDEFRAWTAGLAETNDHWRDFPGMWEVEREDYWPGGQLTPRTDGRRGNWIVVAEVYRGWIDPDFERLSCGHEQRMRKWGGTKYYNLRRVCRQCQLEAGCAPI